LGLSFAPSDGIPIMLDVFGGFQFPFLGIILCTFIFPPKAQAYSGSSFNPLFLGLSFAPESAGFLLFSAGTHFQFPFLGIILCTRAALCR